MHKREKKLGVESMSAKNKKCGNMYKLKKLGAQELESMKVKPRN
jgi:hypothetical protein